MRDGDTTTSRLPGRGDIVRVGGRIAIILEGGMATATVVYIKSASAAAVPVVTKVNAALWGAIEHVDVIQQSDLGAVVGRVSAMAMDKLAIGLQVLQSLT